MLDIPERLRDLIRKERDCAEPTDVDLLEDAAAEVERLRGIEQLAQMWAVYQDDDSKREQQADPWLRQMAETCEENLYNAVAEASPSPVIARPQRMDIKRFQKAPCYICGYNGPGYYQPEVHDCAGLYHEQTNEMP